MLKQYVVALINLIHRSVSLFCVLCALNDILHFYMIYTSFCAVMNNCCVYVKAAAIFIQHHDNIFAIKRDYVIMRRTSTQVFLNRLIPIVRLL